jgi:hypothetical protein
LILLHRRAAAFIGVAPSSGAGSFPAPVFGRGTPAAMRLIGRLGCFLLLFGGILVAIYLASDVAKTPEINFLCFGALAILFGFALWRSGQPPKSESNRFKTVRRMRDRRNKDEQSEK